MSNIYLEKIAARVPLSPIKEVAKSVGRIGLNAVKGVGNQIHLAAGGAYRDYGHNNMHINDVRVLSRMKGNHATKKKIYQHVMNTSGNKDEARKVFKDLREKQLDARMTVGGMAVGAEVLRRKVKEKLDERRIEQYSY